MVKLYQTKSAMKLTKLFGVVLALTFISWVSKDETKKKHHTATTVVTKTPFKFGVWITANAKKSNDEYAKEFEKYKSAGIDEVLINTGTDPKLLKRLVP